MYISRPHYTKHVSVTNSISLFDVEKISSVEFSKVFQSVVNFQASITKNKINVNNLMNHREPEHFISNTNKCTVVYLCPGVFFESFRRIWMKWRRFNFLLLSHLPLCNYYAPITSQVSSNSHRGKHSQVSRRSCVNRENEESFCYSKLET